MLHGVKVLGEGGSPSHTLPSSGAMRPRARFTRIMRPPPPLSKLLQSLGGPISLLHTEENLNILCEICIETVARNICEYFTSYLKLNNPTTHTVFEILLGLQVIFTKNLVKNLSKRTVNLQTESHPQNVVKLRKLLHVGRG